MTFTSLFPDSKRLPPWFPLGWTASFSCEPLGPSLSCFCQALPHSHHKPAQKLDARGDYTLDKKIASDNLGNACSSKLNSWQNRRVTKNTTNQLVTGTQDTVHLTPDTGWGGVGGSKLGHFVTVAHTPTQKLNARGEFLSWEGMSVQIGIFHYFFLKDLVLTCVCVYACVDMCTWVWVPMEARNVWSWAQAAVCCLVWELGPELKSPGRAVCTFGHFCFVLFLFI